MPVFQRADREGAWSSFDRQEIVLRSLVGWAIAERMVLGIVLRVRILLVAPLKPDAPFVWLIAGLMQGVTVACAVCLIVIVASRKMRADVARALLVIAFVLNGLLYIVTSEAIAYLGHGLHPESFNLPLHHRLASGSLQGGAVYRIVILLAAYTIALLAAERRACRATRTVITVPRLAILAIPGVLSIAFAPYINSAETTASPVVQLIEMMYEKRRFQQLHGTIEVPRPVRNETSVRLLMPPAHRKFIDDRYPLAYIPPPRSSAAIRLPSNVRPNIVIILMESMRSAEVGAYGGPIPGLTPNFDTLAKQGILIEDAYSVGGYTPEGELGVWYGLLSSPYEIVIRNRPAAILWGLPELLQPVHYHFLWSHPGDQTFYLSSRFYDHRGFVVSDGSAFDPSEPRTNWGYSDKALARRTVSMLDHFDQPFAAMNLTVSNHHPFELPTDADSFRLRLSDADSERAREDRLIGQRSVPMLRTMHYSDEALGLFFRLARTRRWFRNTIFVVVGDHGTPTKPLHDIRSIHELMELRHHVAMLFYSRMLPGGLRIGGPASQADIVPTLAGLLGFTGPRAGVGVDLLDPADRAQDRPIISWNPEARTVTVTTTALSYHGVVANLGTAPIEFNSEMLIDRARDPIGLDNIAMARPADTGRLRELARIYVEVYPYLIASGRTGVPPSNGH